MRHQAEEIGQKIKNRGSEKLNELKHKAKETYDEYVDDET